MEIFGIRLLFIILIVLSSNVYPKEYHKVEYIGNRFIKNPSKIIKTRHSLPISDSIIKSWQDSLFSFYTRNGFFWTEITVDSIKRKNNLHLVFSIKENERASVKSVEFIGNNYFADSVLSNTIGISQFFSDQLLSSQIQKLLRHYNNHGFPYAALKPQNFILDDTDQTIKYQIGITEGDKVIIRQIKFTDNQTIESRLKQIANLKTPFLYSTNQLNRSLKRFKVHMININNYTIEKIDSIYSLKISIKENKSQALSGIISYSPQYQEFNGFFYFTINNLFKTLRKINIGWENVAQYNNFNINYNDPDLLGFIWEGNFKYNLYDTIYAKSDFNLSTSLPVSDNFQISFGVGYDNINYSILDITNLATTWLGQGVKFSSADHQPLNYSVNYNSRFGSRRTTANHFLINSTLNSTLGFSIFNKTKFLTEWYFNNLYSNRDFYLSDSLRFGGIKTLRGFKENEFSTDRFFLFRNEYSILPGNITSLFLFNDLALFKTLANYQLKDGYGFGLQHKSKLGIFNLSYGIPFKQNILEGKIHLGFANFF